MIDCITPHWPAPANVRALITTRRGGESKGPYSTLNLGDHVGDNPLDVARNRKALREHLPQDPKWLIQVHGDGAVCADRLNGPVEADSAFARRPGTISAVLTADCLPVLLCDEAGTCVAAAHAGWRGLCAGILERTVRAMAIRPEALLAYFGPAIGPEAFVVGPEVRAGFLDADRQAAAAFVRRDHDKWAADLYALATLRLNAAGVTRIYGGDFCTYSEAERFFSHRRDRLTGRMASLIWLAP
jgi:YfiH family protein